jgi:hypothetical protein
MSHSTKTATNGDNSTPHEVLTKRVKLKGDLGKDIKFHVSEFTAFEREYVRKTQ